MGYGYERKWVVKDTKGALKALIWIRNTLLAVISAIKREDLGRKVQIQVKIVAETLKSDPKGEETQCQDSQT